MSKRLVSVTVVMGCVAAQTASASQPFRTGPVALPARVIAIQSNDSEVRLRSEAGWYRAALRDGVVTLEKTDAPRQNATLPNALPDGRVATGSRDIKRAWLAEPTTRYAHGVLGDAIEAGRLVVEHRQRGPAEIVLGRDAVFEDLEPRLADLDGSGKDHVLVVKSYLARGSSLAVIGEQNGRLQILAETPPIGIPHRWLNPAGVADYDGDGHIDIALVMMPHAVGRLELWSWQKGTLVKTHTVNDASNHAIGTRVLRMSATGDFDGDGAPDLAIPSFDRRALRVIAFRPSPREIARISLPGRVTTEIGLVKSQSGSFALLMGLENGAAVAVYP